MAVSVHAAKAGLRLDVALGCSEPIEPPRLCKVFRPSFAKVVHAAEHLLRIAVALLCSEPT